MIIQINATVRAAVDHGGGEQVKIAGRDQRKMVQEGQGRGSYQAEQRILTARQLCRFLEPTQNGVGYEVIMAGRVAREPGDVGN